MEEKKCQACGMPINDETRCKCEGGKCYHCCSCQEGCSCSCKTKE